MNDKNAEKYVSRSVRKLGTAAAVCLTVCAAGIVLLACRYRGVGTAVGLTIFGSLSGSLFVLCFIAEYSRKVIIGEQSVTFPQGTFRDGSLTFGKTEVGFDEILYIEESTVRGDGLFTADTRVCSLMLKDGTTVRVKLSDYGKDAEREIPAIIRSRMARKEHDHE